MGYHVVHRSVWGHNLVGEPLSNKTDTTVNCGRTLTDCGGGDDDDKKMMLIMRMMKKTTMMMMMRMIGRRQK